jgi:hypothetical protein
MAITPENKLTSIGKCLNSALKCDIFRCSKRDCHHRIRIVTNPNDGTVVVEKTDVAHDFAAHDAKTTLTREAKTLITELHDRGMKPKAIRTYFLVRWAKCSLKTAKFF